MWGSSRGWVLSLTTMVLLQLGRAQAPEDPAKDHGQGNDPLLIKENVIQTLENEATSSAYETSSIEAYTEKVEYCDGPLCVRKCCPEGQHFDENWECTEVDDDRWDAVKFVGSTKDIDINQLQVIIGFPPGCDMMEMTILEAETTFQLLPNGQIKVKVDNHTYSEPPSQYCLENREGLESEEGFFCPHEMEPDEDGLGEHCPWHRSVYPTLMSISCFFLILTMAVYAAVPKLRARTYGRCLLSLVSALLVFYFMQIANYLRNVKGTKQCIVLAFFSHVNGLAIFFWLNVMAFELWRTVNSNSPIQPSMKTFLMYSVYAWGTPFILGFITLGIDYLPETYDSKYLIRPNLAGSSCGLDGKKERWAYLYWVIVLITVVNICFFSHICYKFCQAKARLNKRDNNFWMFLKMFLIMGIPWVLDVFSTRECLWFFGDIFNLLQGVGIFLATVCNKFTFGQLMEWLSPRIRGLDQFWKDVNHRVSSSAGPSTTYTRDARSRIISQNENSSSIAVDQENQAATYKK